MFVTGRFPMLVAAGAVPLVALGATAPRAWAILGAWAVVCVAVAAIDALAAPRTDGLRIGRDAPARARLGESVRTRIRFVNAGGRTVSLRARDAWQPTAGAPAERLSARIPPHESRTLEVPLLPRRRGEIVSAFVTVRTLGPLGVAGRQASIPSEARIRVLPPFRARRHLASRVARLRELDGSTSLLVRGRGTEFDSLRAYVPGDDVRSIDWRATARSRETVVRAWRPERDRHVTIVIDTGRTSATRVEDGTRLDATFEAAMLVAALADRAGDHVHLLAFDREARARVSGASGADLLPAIADALAGVDPRLIDTDWDAALAEARRMARRPSLVVLLTAQDDVTSSRAFLARLPGLARGGTAVLVGTVTDTDLTGAARSAGSMTEVFRAAAAEAALREAERVASAISRAGAEALADGPEALPPRIADRYLALKRAGRL
ncbi:DUF58 domain-containing protein [Microbacterium sp. ZXX196]|uniref:DUF58 domain-containing protein n=1 Tax=Microbacterium sp. ZXX196 TaxID=2609291 RepID=UPI00132997DE|nr:DUF58 domain-containing protein [Microbacterium sp. ZXX196]